MGSVTAAERAIVLQLAEAWNRVCELPVEHKTDGIEFERAIHQAQALVLMRAGRREVNGVSPGDFLGGK